jgi:CheY-like chemotaxis protein
LHLEKETGKFDVKHVTHPADALEQLSGNPDCIVSGYRMPEMNGIELLKTIRETHPTLPFILFTARHQRAVAREATAAGLTDYEYLQKRSGTDHFTDLATLVSNTVLQRDSNPALASFNTPS